MQIINSNIQQFLLPSNQDEYFFISQEGLTTLRDSFNPSEPAKEISWTTNINAELPIRMKKEGRGAKHPYTVIEQWYATLKKNGQQAALHHKVKGANDYTIYTYQQYYEKNRTFGKALIKCGITERAAINIIGFNHPVWMWVFHGSIFANCVPVGVYCTNGKEICEWIAKDCNAEIVVVENQRHLEKYLSIWEKGKKIKYILIYNDQNINWDVIPQHRRQYVMQFEDFMKFGESKELDTELTTRMNKQKPGNCCNIVYTSGTTGQPKGAMISHDNFTWCSECCMLWFNMYEKSRFISYLPLSHVAAQVLDIFGAVNGCAQIFFGDENALKGTLVSSMKDGLPTFFMGVPRVFEKIEEKFRTQSANSSWLKKKIVSWAKSGTFEATFKEQATPEETPLSLQVKKALLLNQIKKAIGLNEANDLIVGAGACSSSTRRFFMNLNLPLTACFGMTELTGPVAFTNFSKFKEPNQNFLQACGQVFEGVDVKTVNGEIQFLGRNRFMGYLNNIKETREAIDSNGYLHSGDVGFLDEQKNLTITGRKKEILKTAGGENIAPVPIETMLKEEIPILSNAVIVGDKRKYLISLLVLSTEENSIHLIPETIQALTNLGMPNIKTIADAKSDPAFIDYIQKNIDIVNSKAISRASNIRKWAILDHDFSIEGSELTPTMKVKRNVVYQKYIDIIEQLYSSPNL